MKVDVLQDIIFACMNAQQQHQLELIKQSAYAPPSQTVIVLLPPLQQNMITQGKPQGMQVLHLRFFFFCKIFSTASSSTFYSNKPWECQFSSRWGGQQQGNPAYANTRYNVGNVL